MSRATDFLEQDVGGAEGDGLPTYENLAETHGPNSRFGRWKSWVEKRAAERYSDITPDELERRRRRGWGEGTTDDIPISQNRPSTVSTPGPSSFTPPLQLRTEFNYDNLPNPDGIQFGTEFDHDNVSTPQGEPDGILEYDPSRPIVGESLRPAHLGLHHLGSRFLPHATSPIRALLPLLGDRLLLIGHDDGLSVLNMFPQEWTDTGLQTRGPGEATAHPIWTGEGVFQMSILEVEDIGESTPQGVALFLVSCESENGKEQESMRVLRMYNLSSLISLAKWAISRKGAPPLDLRRALGWQPHRSTSKKRASNNLAKGLKSLVFDAPQEPEPLSSYHTMVHASPGYTRRANPRQHIAERSTSSLDSAWDVVDDLPLRWATDYVPLAVPGSRLMNASVFTYALWRNDDQPRSSTLLAVGVKSAVLLYESPKGERAFRFIKEFYTPLPSRGIMFVHQNLQDSLSRSVSDASGVLPPASPQSHARGSRSSMRQRPSSFAITVLDPQLSLFVVFEKKVGLIRIVNSAVGEVAFFEDPTTLTARDSLSYSPSISSSSSSMSTPSGLASLPGRRSRTSLDGFGVTKDISRGAWTVPTKLDLPDSNSTPTTATATVGPWDTEVQPRSIYLVTRGKQTFALRCPLPANMHVTVPLLTFHWRSPPSFVVPRVVDIEYGGSAGAGVEGRSIISDCSASEITLVVPQRCQVLQMTAFNEDGLEIQEILLSSLFRNERQHIVEEAVPVVASDVVLGETGFLTRGGHWDRPYDAPIDLSRSFSVRSAASVNTMATAEVVSRLESNQGTYGWQCRGLGDWRVFWIGGMGEMDG